MPSRRCARGLTPAVLLLAAAPLLAACQAVEYRVDPNEVALLPRDNALRYLQSLPGASYPAIAYRKDDEHCEFASQGLRIARANPRYAETVADVQQQELRRIAQLRPDAEQALRKVQDEQRDFAGWLRLRGYPDLLAEERRLGDEHASAERWLRLRGMPADQIDKAKVEIDKEKKEFDGRMSDARRAAERERESAEDRVRDLDRQAGRANDAINEARARVHEHVTYREAGFVVYSFLSRMTVDIDYRLPNGKTDSCGFDLDKGNPAAMGLMQRVVTALAALGAEPQHGVSADPPKR